MDRRIFLLEGGLGLAGMLAGCAALRKTTQTVVAKSPAIPRETAVQAYKQDFFEKYSPLLFDNLVQYKGVSGYRNSQNDTLSHLFALGAPADASEEDKKKAATYPLVKFFNTLFLDDERTLETVAAFIKSRYFVHTGEIADVPVTDLRIVVNREKERSNILYVGRNRKISGDMTDRRRSVVWKVGDRIGVYDRFFDDAVMNNLTEYVKTLNKSS